ncbi:hypothetical protein NQ317_012484 [Molorchus minor]|uniref:UBA domain-containing protein n=1 Tax=Molorchus minor TaxID=1323400 RepID=A0ABQ9K1C2_9CUCU|nr:hypothetical protein NQ317_012484 [Molorchus minor]
MNSELEKQDILIQIRDKLRKDGIKLWLQPYYAESVSDKDIKQLSQDYSSFLNIPYEFCHEIILELQANSLENLKQKNRFQVSGLATVKIKILLPNSPPQIVTKELLLSITASDLKAIIHKELNFSDSLSSQGVKNGHQILAITIAESPIQIKEAENTIKELESIKTDSRLLALDNDFMQLEDQFGNPIKIPPNEKKSLVVAMTLHERKSCFKTRCNSQLLKTVDNYALLDLDIAWCYLCLESFAHLPEAYERLKRCEDNFHSTYGPNLERLIAVKGTPGNEEALFMRLHLLQAIVLYHQNKRPEALSRFKKAEEEIRKLKVDEQSVMALVELGYTPAEATLGLRATNGDVNLSANYIKENREKRAEGRKRAKAEEILRKEQKKLGKCADGTQYVNPNFVNILVNMGFNKEAARLALQKTNNIISDSVEYIQENPLPGPSGTRSKELMSFIEDLIPELEDAGFDPRMAKLALEKHSGDIMKAAEELLMNNGIITGDLSGLISPESIDNIKKKKLEYDEKNEAFKRLAEDITLVDDDYLDINLVQEEMFLQQYLSLLEKK